MSGLKRLGGLAVAGMMAAGGLLSAGAAQASGLLNGDFELGPISIGTGSNAYYRGIPTSWTQIPGLDVVDIIENGYAQIPPPLLLAQSGTHFLDMNGLGASGGITQDVAGLTPGEVMRLSLYTGQWATNSAGETVTFGLFDGSNGVLLNSFLITGIDGTGWTQHSLTAIVPGSGILRVQIAGNTGFQAGPGVDNVTLTVDGAGGVPEPTGWALMIIGFGGTGAVLRDQRRRQAAAV